MYKEKVIENINKAVETSKKKPTQWLIMALVGAAVTASSVWWLIKSPRHRDYTHVISYDDSDTIGVVGLIAGIIFLIGGLYMLFSTLKLYSKGSADRIAGKYLQHVKKLGPENEVFAQLEALKPVGSETEPAPYLKDAVFDDLRISPTLVACTSEADPDKNFVCSISDITAAGTTGRGLYLHHKETGKKKKCVVSLPANGVTGALSLFNEYAPGVVQKK